MSSCGAVKPNVNAKRFSRPADVSWRARSRDSILVRDWWTEPRAFALSLLRRGRSKAPRTLVYTMASAP